MPKLEDKHIQLTVKYPEVDFDIILRTNDELTKYVAIDIFDYREQKFLKTINLENAEYE